MKVLNLYACLGGNRYKWTDCEVTAVELDPEAARLYQERFPNDTVIIADAELEAQSQQVNIQRAFIQWLKTEFIAE
jgi:hypothetical protein